MIVPAGKPDQGNKSVTLFVPGFTLHDIRQVVKLTGQKHSLSAVELLFSRGSYQRGNARSVEQVLFDLFNIPNTNNLEFPVGALTRYLVKGDTGIQKWAMRADPVYIQPNREQLVLLGNSGLDISLQDAERMVNDINSTYHDTAWQIAALTPRQWILEQDAVEQIQTHALNEVVGKNINSFLPAGAEEKKWRALMNELQMFLHAHPVNQQRQMQGLPVVNSLWFWGAGVLPAPVTDSDKSFIQCWSGETISLALSRLNNVPRRDLPEKAEDWLKQAISPGHHLLVIEQLFNDIVKSDPLEWWQSFNEFVEQWLTPLVAAIKQNTLEQINLVDSDGSCYQLTPRMSKRWWKWVERI